MTSLRKIPNGPIEMLLGVGTIFTVIATFAVGLVCALASAAVPFAVLYLIYLVITGGLG